jgi:hypothetical protein
LARPLVTRPPREEEERAPGEDADEADSTVDGLQRRRQRLTALAFEILRVAAVEAEVDDSAAPTIDPEAPPVRSAKRLQLLGTLVATEPDQSVASIQDCVTLETRTYARGDVIQGAELISIERRRVIVKDGERREFVGDGPDGACHSF